MDWSNIDTPLDRVHRRARATAQAAPHLPPQPVLRRSPREDGGGCAHPRRGVAASRRLAHAARGLGQRLRPGGGGSSSTARASVARPPRRVISDDHFLVLFNAGDDTVDFRLPDFEYAPKWDAYVDTAGERANTEPLNPGETLPLEPKSLFVLREHHLPEPRSTTRSRPRSRRRSRSSAPTTCPARRPSRSCDPRCGIRFRPTACRSANRSPSDDAAEVTDYLRDLGVSWAYPLADPRGHPGLRPRLRRRRRHARRPRPRRCRGSLALRRGGAREGSGHPDRHRAQPHGRLRAARERVVVGRPAPGARLGARRRVRHRLGVRRRQGARPRARRSPRRGDR